MYKLKRYQIYLLVWGGVQLLNLLQEGYKFCLNPERNWKLIFCVIVISNILIGLWMLYGICSFPTLKTQYEKISDYLKEEKIFMIVFGILNIIGLDIYNLIFLIG